MGEGVLRFAPMEPGWYPPNKKANDKHLDPRYSEHHSEGGLGPWLRQDLVKHASLWVVQEHIVGIPIEDGKFIKITPDHIKGMDTYTAGKYGDLCFLATTEGEVICIIMRHPGMILFTYLPLYKG